MFRKLNRKFQDYMRPKRLAIGKWIWDRKEKEKIKNIDMTKINSILFSRYDGKIGDMVVSTLLFREVKKNYPHIKVGVIARGAALDIIKNNPYVDIIYKYEKGKERELGEKISNEKYDILVDFSEMLRVKDMKLINLCHAKINIGLNKKDWNLFDISLEPKKDFKWDEHIVLRYGAYLKKIGINKYQKKYDIYLDEIESDKKNKNKNKKLKVVLNPYGASKHKHFNEVMLDKIIKYLLMKNCEIIFIYYPEKYEELKNFLKKYNNEDVILPKNIKTILDSSKIIKSADMVITPDTSIVHIASALEKKIISVYPPKGGTYGVDHLVWGPLDKNNKILFCQDKKYNGDEIDINTFKFQEFEKMFENYIS